VKIAFDENIPRGMVRVFQTLSAESHVLGVTVVSASDFKPPGEAGDEHWVRRFAADGGRMLISGDERMRTVPQERAALSTHRIITFFFDSRWNKSNGFVKCAMLLNWWPRIIEIAASSRPGQCWQIPFQWNWTAMRDVTPGDMRPQPRRSRRVRGSS
jgi:hypothetical protein